MNTLGNVRTLITAQTDALAIKNANLYLRMAICAEEAGNHEVSVSYENLAREWVARIKDPVVRQKCTPD